MKDGDLIKESWQFHGFQSGPNGEIEKVVLSPRSFRIVTYNSSLRYDIDRVNRMGWPVSQYKIEKISKEEAIKLAQENKYDSYYKCFREINEN
jgi:hypothetical protein